jgi:hypothetical protein
VFLEVGVLTTYEHRFGFKGLYHYIREKQLIFITLFACKFWLYDTGPTAGNMFVVF